MPSTIRFNCESDFATTAMEDITPESITDGGSVEDIDDNFCQTNSPQTSDIAIISDTRQLSANPATAEKVDECKWTSVKVCVGFDVTRKGMLAYLGTIYRVARIT